MGGGPPGIRGEMMKHLYPVELVRRHADEIELSESQYEKLRSTVVKVKGEVEKISWDMDREAQKLVDLVAKGAKSEEIYAQMDRVFEYENKIKKLHLGLLLSVRDILTDKQRKQLDQIRQQRRGGEGAPGARRGKVRK
jgi:Spy/CpxP family protein refolding chaperone